MKYNELRSTEKAPRGQANEKLRRHRHMEHKT